MTVLPTAFEKLKKLAEEILRQRFPESKYTPKYDEEWIYLIGNLLRDYQKKENEKIQPW